MNVNKRLCQHGNLIYSADTVAVSDRDDDTDRDNDKPTKHTHTPPHPPAHPGRTAGISGAEAAIRRKAEGTDRSWCPGGPRQRCLDELAFHHVAAAACAQQGGTAASWQGHGPRQATRTTLPHSTRKQCRAQGCQDQQASASASASATTTGTAPASIHECTNS